MLLLIALPSASLIEASNIPSFRGGYGDKSEWYVIFGHSISCSELGSRMACLGALTSVFATFYPESNSSAVERSYTDSGLIQ